LDNKDFKYVEQKLRTVNPVLFCQAFLKVRILEDSRWKLLKRVWKKSKGNAIALVLLSPFALLKTRKLEESLGKYNEIFIESNKKLKEKLPKAEKESEKMFLTTFIQLNTIATEMNVLILETNRKLVEANKLKGIFTQNPTTKTLLRLWNVIKDIIVSDTQLMKLQREKADIQDKVVEHEREMTKLEKRDIQDFWRAILTDALISYTEQRVIVVGTPVEILLKSGRIVNKIRKAFFVSEALREGANLRKESIDELMNWFISYQEKSG
jgi:hypothetical protein